MISPRAGAAIGALAAIAAACVLPTGGCACTPRGVHGVLYGVVTGAAGAAVPGARLVVRPAYPTCDAPPGPVWSNTGLDGGTPTPSASDGGYAIRFLSLAALPCVSVAAIRPAGDSVVVVVPQPAMGDETEVAPRTRLDVTFP